MEEYGLHHLRRQAKEQEWQQQQAYEYQQQQLGLYYNQRLVIHHRLNLRLSTMASNLLYLTRTTTTITNTHKPSHFSFFSYNIHDKDEFRKNFSRTEEKPNYNKNKIQKRDRWELAAKNKKYLTSKQPYSYTPFPPN